MLEISRSEYPYLRFATSGISVSSRATVLLPLHSRHSLTLMQYEIASEWVSPRSHDRHLPASVPLLATPLALPLPWTCDRARDFLPVPIGVRNKPER